MTEQDRWILRGWSGFVCAFLVAWVLAPIGLKHMQATPLQAVPAADVVTEAPVAVESVTLSAKDREALILNAFNEARGEGRAGILAVLGVTMARVESQCYPDSVEDVVFQRKQFSWTAQRGAPRTLARAARVDAEALDKVQEIVDEFIAAGAKPNNSLLYHADYVSPSWAKSRQVKKVKTVGNHLFYDLQHC